MDGLDGQSMYMMGNTRISGRLKAEITARYINTAEFLLPVGVILTKGMRKR